MGSGYQCLELYSAASQPRLLLPYFRTIDGIQVSGLLSLVLITNKQNPAHIKRENKNEWRSDEYTRVYHYSYGRRVCGPAHIGMTKMSDPMRRRKASPQNLSIYLINYKEFIFNRDRILRLLLWFDRWVRHHRYSSQNKGITVVEPRIYVCGKWCHLFGHCVFMNAR